MPDRRREGWNATLTESSWDRWRTQPQKVPNSTTFRSPRPSAGAGQGSQIFFHVPGIPIWYTREMDVETIARKTRLSPRTLRYAIYHGVAAGIDKIGEGKGVVRSYTPFEAFGIAVAAKLLESGLKRDFAQQCLSALVRGRPHSNINQLPLARALNMRSGEVYVDVADRKYIRLRGGSGHSTINTGWMAATTTGNPPAANPEPDVMVSVRLSGLRDALRV